MKMSLGIQAKRSSTAYDLRAFPCISEPACHVCLSKYIPICNAVDRLWRQAHISSPPAVMCEGPVCLGPLVKFTFSFDDRALQAKQRLVDQKSRLMHWDPVVETTIWSPRQTDYQVDASQRKFAKPELAHGLAMGGQTDSQVVTFTYIQMTCNELVSICVGWPNSEKRASTCVRIWARPKSTQVGGQTKRKLNANRKLASVDLRLLASPFGQRLGLIFVSVS